MPHAGIYWPNKEATNDATLSNHNIFANKYTHMQQNPGTESVHERQKPAKERKRDTDQCLIGKDFR